MGWLVGGELKLLMEKERVEPAARVEATTLVTSTVADMRLPWHWSPELTF